MREEAERGGGVRPATEAHVVETYCVEADRAQLHETSGAQPGMERLVMRGTSSYHTLRPPPPLLTSGPMPPGSA